MIYWPESFNVLLHYTIITILQNMCACEGEVYDARLPSLIQAPFPICSRWSCWRALFTHAFLLTDVACAARATLIVRI